MEENGGSFRFFFSAILFFTLSPAAGIAADQFQPGSLYKTFFQQAADEFDVPSEILLAVTMRRPAGKTTRGSRASSTAMA